MTIEEGRIQEEYNQNNRMKQAKLSASAQFGVNSYWLFVNEIGII